MYCYNNIIICKLIIIYYFRLLHHNPYNGITRNQSEEFNTMLNQYQHWKEAPVNSIVLGLYHLPTMKLKEVWALTP